MVVSRQSRSGGDEWPQPWVRRDRWPLPQSSERWIPTRSVGLIVCRRVDGPTALVARGSPEQAMEAARLIGDRPCQIVGCERDHVLVVTTPGTLLVRSVPAPRPLPSLANELVECGYPARRQT